jgi:hypothetical protein
MKRSRNLAIVWIMGLGVLGVAFLAGAILSVAGAQSQQDQTPTQPQGPESMRSAPPDTAPYVRPAVPEDHTPAGKPAIPPDEQRKPSSEPVPAESKPPEAGKD